MDFTNNVNGPNVSSLIASSISRLNLNSVKKTDLEQNIEVTALKNIKEQIKEEETPVILDDSNTKKVDVDDIRKYAKMMGEDVSIDDINYGIMYGRSVIADYIA